ncbi:MAG: HAD family hydrolase [Clostridiales bacterium]|nr:HAD family hydrolase [Clostridiales bacterium]
MIKALFFDLDGTLLDSARKISPITRATLERCKKDGIKLYIATARPPLLGKMLLWDDGTLSLFDGGVYYNGGCVILGGHKTYTYISGDVVQKIIRLACQYDALNIALQLEDENHAFRFPLQPESHQRWGVSEDKILTLDRAKGLRAVKILVFYSDLINSVDPLDKKLIEDLEKLCLDTAQLYLTDKGRVMQIMAGSVNKLNSTESIRMFLGLDKSELAVFGDDVNDTEMLSSYENSVAMGNADAYVKSKAKYVTFDNDNDGIHHAICNILCL